MGCAFLVVRRNRNGKHFLSSESWNRILGNILTDPNKLCASFGDAAVQAGGRTPDYVYHAPRCELLLHARATRVPMTSWIVSAFSNMRRPRFRTWNRVGIVPIISQIGTTHQLSLGLTTRCVRSSNRQTHVRKTLPHRHVQVFSSILASRPMTSDPMSTPGVLSQHDPFCFEPNASQNDYRQLSVRNHT
jgi:hypothetical protein